MACVSLKRPFELDPTYQSRPNKRAKYAPRSCTSPSDSNMTPTPSKLSPPQGAPTPFAQTSSQLTPDKMAANIKEEAHRLNLRKQLSFSQENSGENVEGQKSLFTYSQVGLICERMLKEQEERIREEYSEILSAKLAEQYDTFVKFTHDQLQKKLRSAAHMSYLS